MAKKMKKAKQNKNESSANEAVVNDLAISQFLAGMSHEIRTPLNAIIGLSEVLTEEGLDNEQKTYINMIRESAQNILVLLNDVLDFSKIQAGSLELNVSEILVEHLLAVIESLMRPRAVEKQLSFSVLQHTDLPTVIKSDAVRLRQCILNLVSYSLSSTKQGHIYVNISLEKINGQDFMKFEVEDTSDGMTKEQIDLLFEQFNQDATLDVSSNTSGLGLAITKKITELLGGQISVTSESGKGATYTLLIPTGVDVENQPSFSKYDRMGKSRQDYIQPTDFQFRGRVLVAEDTPTNQTLIRLLLEKFGLDVTIATDGLDVCEKTQSEDFDLILMDIQMPNMNGYDATRKLRQGGFTKPIIAVTAHAMRGDRQKCLDAGCDDYISKPISQNELIKVLKLHLPLDEARNKVDIVNTEIQELTGMLKQNDEQSEQSIQTEYQVEGQDLINYDAITEICDDEKVITQVVSMFLNDSPGCIASLAEAIKDANPKHVQMYAHSLKGACLQIGAEKLADIAYRLECAGRDKNFEHVPELFNSIQDEYGKLSLFLSQPDWMEQAKQQV